MAVIAALGIVLYFGDVVLSLHSRLGDIEAGVWLQIGVIEEAITVSSATPLLDTTSALKQTVLTREEQQALPNLAGSPQIALTGPAGLAATLDLNPTAPSGIKAALNLGLNSNRSLDGRSFQIGMKASAGAMTA